MLLKQHILNNFFKARKASLEGSKACRERSPHLLSLPGLKPKEGHLQFLGKGQRVELCYTASKGTEMSPLHDKLTSLN